MARYYVVAALIVLVLGSVLFAHRLTPPDVRIAARPTGTPTVETASRDGARTPRPFSGQGPWVLSALPDCFDEQSRISGPAADLGAKLPPAGARISPGTTLRAGACTVVVRERDILVDRGSDRLRVPPDAALYRVDGRLTLVVRDGATLEIRRY